MAVFNHLVEHLEADNWQLLWTSFVVGVSVHLAIGYSNIEFERYLIRSFGVATIAYCGSLVVLSQYSQHGVLLVIATVSLAYVGLGAGFLMSLTIYRLFLHRCRGFPGPRLAGLLNSIRRT